MWSIQHSERTTASPEELWIQYQDTDNGPTWDPMVLEIKLHGPFAVGTTGTNKPTFGPKVKFVYTEVQPYSSYTEISKAFGADMVFTHEIKPTANGCNFEHGITCKGPLAGLYSLLLKRSYTRLLPIAMKALAHTAEQGKLAS